MMCRYHSLHHTEMGTNFCLFMPLFDALGKTLNGNSWELQKQISSSLGGSSSINAIKFKQLSFMCWLRYNFMTKDSWMVEIIKASLKVNASLIKDCYTCILLVLFLSKDPLSRRFFFMVVPCENFCTPLIVLQNNGKVRRSSIGAKNSPIFKLAYLLIK